MSLTTTLSDDGLHMIARFEGFRAEPYDDTAGYATIGYGHLMHYGPVDEADQAKYPDGISQADALHLLRSDCLAAQRAVQQLVTRPLGHGQFDALCSFAFNCGAGALAHSTLLVDVNKHLGAEGAATITADFLSWDHAGGVEVPGLRTRRQAEAHLYLEGVYPS